MERNAIMGTDSKECRAVNTDDVMIACTSDRETPAIDAGFTFVEIIIALAILSIAITGLVGFITVNTMTSVRAKELSRVTDSMADLADRLRAMPYKDAGVAQTKYVSSDGSVVMDLTTTTSKVNNANIKTILIDGYSTLLTPNLHRQTQVILRNSSNDLGETVDPGTEPVIDDFHILPQGSQTPAVAGQTLWGNVQFVYTTHASYSPAVLTIRIYVNSVLISEKGNATENVGWNTADIADGPKQITMVVSDDHGGVTTRNLTTGSPDIVLDNQPVSNTVPASAISTTNNNSGQITFQWNSIPDPANSSDNALRYRVILYSYKSNGTLNNTQQKDVSASTLGQYPSNSASFSYSAAEKSYKVEVHAMCPVGCTGHDGPNAGANNGLGQVGTGYLSKSGSF